jgi:hypothetical protein
MRLASCACLALFCGPDRWLQGGSHPSQHHGVDAIGLGKRADGLGKTPYRAVG